MKIKKKVLRDLLEREYTRGWNDAIHEYRKLPIVARAWFHSSPFTQEIVK